MSLVEFAHNNGIRLLETLTRSERKELGQFMTPPLIAKAMARRACAGLEAPSIKLLDPAAGAGILAAAALEALLSSASRPCDIHILLFEIDRRFAASLKLLANRMRRSGRRLNVQIRVSVRIEDFLLSEASKQKTRFDLVMANPPYLKLNKKDPRSLKHAYAVHGQPNIYGLFMAASARQLAPGGRWCFITPRSWTNGMYFASVRREILRWLKVDAIHIFESRREHFAEDEILQEAIITWASAQAEVCGPIVVSVSQGAWDLPAATLRTMEARDVIGSGKRRVISLPAAGNTFNVRLLTSRLSTYGLRVSTGPVVAFRASEYLSEKARREMVPLLWMQHIHHMKIEWPIQKKREHIQANGETAWMLVRNSNMVLMRRFSPKESERRITAAPYIGGSLPGPSIGLENHTNYIYRPGGEMTTDEAKGIAAYLNSRPVDRYFREIAGNTQVNAEDLRSLPLPSREVLVEIGRKLPEACTLKNADQVVDSIFHPYVSAEVA